MALSVTDRLTTFIVGTSLSSNNFAANNNALLIALGWGFNGALGISDTFTDTGGGTWQTIYNFSLASGAHMAAWYRILGTTPGTNHVVMSNAANDECVLGVVEIGGNYDTTTPIRQNITNTTNSTATLALTLGLSPRSDSAMISNVFDINNSSATITNPTGFTGLTNQTFDGDAQASGYLNGSGTTSITWGGFNTTSTPDCGGYFEVQTTVSVSVTAAYQIITIPPTPFPYLRQVLNSLRDPRLEPVNRPVFNIRAMEPPQIVQPMKVAPNLRDPRLDFVQPSQQIRILLARPQPVQPTNQSVVIDPRQNFANPTFYNISSALPARPLPKMPGVFSSLQISTGPVVTGTLPLWQFPSQTSGITMTPVDMIDFR